LLLLPEEIQHLVFFADLIHAINMISTLPEEKLKDLELKANQARQLVIEMLLEAGSGHSAGSLGMADIFTAFYFHILKHDPKNPSFPDRDRLILSNGHICPIRYATMAMSGYFPLEELKTLRKLGSRLQGHPHRTSLPGLETTSTANTKKAILGKQPCLPGK
jgi:transketolase